MPFNLVALAPYLGASGNALVNLDDNKTGADDYSGELLIYGSEVIGAVAANEDLPPLPEFLTKGVTEKITGAGRVTLTVASSILPLAQFQVTGKARVALKYISQVIRDLLNNQPIPPIPPNIRQALT